MQRFVFLVLAAALSACATTAPTSASASATALAAPKPADDDVVILKERVSRLERRLADVDAKLGLLLAQRTPARAAPTVPRDLIVDSPPPKEEASLGARSIDFATRRSVYEEDPAPVVTSAPEEDSGPPIVIRVVGDAESHSDPKSERAPSGAALDPESNSGLPVADLYAEGQAHVKAGEYIQAIGVFEDIATRHAHHKLAGNAVYWIGWCHQARGDHKLAVDVWQKLPMRYPKSAKVPDALFGMAVSEESLKEPAVAETLYEQLVTQYPRADKVGDAKRALSRLRPR